MIELQCRCGAKLTVPNTAIGQASKCATCQAIMRPIAGTEIAPGDQFDTGLEIIAGPARVGEQLFLAGRGPISLGKLPTSSIALDGNMVSRKHCTLTREDPSFNWLLEDLNSTNGVRINQTTIHRQTLEPGDIVVVGEYQLKYSVAASRAMQAPAVLPVASIVAPGDEPNQVYGILEAQNYSKPVRKAVPKGPAVVCPSCNHPLPFGSKICIDCGIDIKTGKPLVTAHGVDENQLEIVTHGILRWLSFLLPIGIIPVASEAYGKHKPYFTWIIAGLTTIISIIFWIEGGLSTDASNGWSNLMLWGGKPSALKINFNYEQLGPIVDWVDQTNGWDDAQLLSDNTKNSAKGREIAKLIIAAKDPKAMAMSRSDAEADSDPRAIAYAKKKEELKGSVDDSQLPVAAYEALDPGDKIFPQFQWYQLITNTFLHGGILHLAGNMVFLLVLGGRVNAVLGQIQSAILYLAFGVIASAAQYISASNGPLIPALGASGAIMGMAGMYLVLFPIHRIFMAFWIRPAVLFLPLLIFAWFLIIRLILIRFIKVWSLRGFWVLLFYIAFDVVATIRGSQDGTAHWAHLGGFIAGMIVALGLIIARVVNAGGGDIISVLLGKRAWAIVGKPTDRPGAAAIAVPSVRGIDISYH